MKGMSSQRERIDVKLARQLYDRLRNWPAVARELRRRNGQSFQPGSICAAVRWVDRGFAGTRV